MSLNRTVENVYLRQDAFQLTRLHFWKMLGMYVILFSLTAGLDYSLTWLGDLIMGPEIQALTEAAQHAQSTGTSASDALLTKTLLELFTSPKFLVYNLVFIVLTGIIRAGLSLGYQRQMISIGRGTGARVPGIFSRMQYGLKAWGLTLWIGLKTLLWPLLGLLILMFTAAAAILLIGDSGKWVMAIGPFLMLGLGIWAAFRYAMAPYLLADEPARGIRECVKLSTLWMQGRKWQYFKLFIPVILKGMGVTFLVGMLCSLVCSLCGWAENPQVMEIVMLISTASATYWLMQEHLLSALFYIKRRNPIPVTPVSTPVNDEAAADSSPDTPETDTKENDHEEPDC